MNLNDTRGARNGVAVTGSDQTIQGGGRAIYVGGAGNLVCRLCGDTDNTTFTGLLAGVLYPFQIAAITGSGTTITNSVILT